MLPAAAHLLAARLADVLAAVPRQPDAVDGEARRGAYTALGARGRPRKDVWRQSTSSPEAHLETQARGRPCTGRPRAGVHRPEHGVHEVLLQGLFVHQAGINDGRGGCAVHNFEAQVVESERHLTLRHPARASAAHAGGHGRPANARRDDIRKRAGADDRGAVSEKTRLAVGELAHAVDCGVGQLRRVQRQVLVELRSVVALDAPSSRVSHLADPDQVTNLIAEVLEVTVE
mmetsp:Transcript_148728/g.477624  ORF Transcript_148728/g.477624 Transcript_148728/m.477624 type:complete len:231 (+) Transcript_148728:512-1204(+)